VASIDPAEYGRRIEPLLEQAGAYAVSLLSRRADAEDAVQQAALQGLERFDSYDSTQPFKGWWFAIVRNCCYDMLRVRQRSQPLDEGPASQSRALEPSETLCSAFARLSSEHAEILRLKYFGGLSYSEIAQTLNIPQGTVMSRLHLARKALAAVVRIEDFK